jgi:LysR family transcriptional regulator, hca operon transcriptional activator
VRNTPHLEIDNFARAISLVGSTGAVALLPASIDAYLPPSIVSRSLAGEQPIIDLVPGFHKANKSPILEKFLATCRHLHSSRSKARGPTTVAFSGNSRL